MRLTAAVVLTATALLLAGCSDTQSQPTAGPSTVPSSSVPLPTTQPSTTEPPSTSGTPTPTQASCIDQKLKTLTLREQASQLIMTGISANGMTSSQRPIVQKQKPGGVLLLFTGGSLTHTRTAMAAVTAAATVNGVRPLIAADQEGGQIQRLKGSGFDRIPAATVQGTWSGDKLTQRAEQWGDLLKEAGVNVDLAPVADVVSCSLKQENAPIGSLYREYGDTPEDVGPHVQAFGKGMQAADGIVIISTATYTKIDPKNRAVFSETVIQEMVRGDMEYDGVVITDDVGAAAEVASVPAGQRATRFVAAGGDIVINAKAVLTATMVNALVAKAQQDKAFKTQLTSSVRRVLTLKQNHGLVSCG